MLLPEVLAHCVDFGDDEVLLLSEVLINHLMKGHVVVETIGVVKIELCIIALLDAALPYVVVTLINYLIWHLQVQSHYSWDYLRGLESFRAVVPDELGILYLGLPMSSC